jgi:hypothetical protein
VAKALLLTSANNGGITGMVVYISVKLLSSLLKKLKTELAITAKLAMAKAAKMAQTKEFQVILSTASMGSIGLLLL